jgi:hypothetical protein
VIVCLISCNCTLHGPVVRNVESTAIASCSMKTHDAQGANLKCLYTGSHIVVRALRIGNEIKIYR